MKTSVKKIKIKEKLQKTEKGMKKDLGNMKLTKAITPLIIKMKKNL